MSATASPLVDRTNVTAANLTPTRLRSPSKSPFVPPPPPPESIDEAPVKAAATPVKREVTFEQALLTHRMLKEKLATIGAQLLNKESSLSHYLFAGGQLAFAAAAFGDVNVLNLSAWGGLAYLLCGGVASAVGKTGSARPPLTMAELEPLVARLVDVLNKAQQLHRAIFLCGSPKLALKGAAALYALTLLSARLPTILILWSAFTLGFLVPKIAPHLEPHLKIAKSVALEKASEANDLLEAKCPKKFTLPFGVLLWYWNSSYSTMALTMGVSCIGFQAWRESNPLAEAEFKELTENADAAFQQVKKKARRLTISAKDMMRGKLAADVDDEKEE